LTIKYTTKQGVFASEGADIVTPLTPSYATVLELNGIAREDPMDSRDDDLRGKIDRI
jgi:hypothetical protein